jgi:hypothetical protein
MKLVEAVALGNEFVTRTTGAIGDPILVRFLEREGTGASWRLVYGSRLFFPDLKDGAVMDGGELVLDVDVVSGTVSLRS